MEPNLYFNSLDDLLNCNFGKMRTLLDLKFPAFENALAGNQPVILYPSARMARHAALELQTLGVNVLGFGDGNSSLWGTKINGLRVMSADYIAKNHGDAAVFVSSVIYDSSITEMLKSHGITSIVPVTYLNHKLPNVFVSRDYSNAFESAANPRNHSAIREIYNSLCDDQSRLIFRAKLEYYLTFDKQILNSIESPNVIYFDSDILSLGPVESFVDGGAYVGDTLGEFLTACGGQFKEYYAFEPDTSNFEKLCALSASDPARIHPLKFGLAKKSGNVRFLSTSTVDSKILCNNEEGGESLKSFSLDEFFSDRQPPTMIKMDIEGSEADALIGASKIISQFQPKLAISIYHHPKDFWNLPLLIKRLSPKSKLYMRHYGKELADSVCYAVPA
jgi:FkbM family methyltransferase